VFEAFDLDRVVGLDLVFLGLPHEASLALAPQLVGRVGCVVDLSAAYRLKDPAAYPAFYGFEHDQPEPARRRRLRAAREAPRPAEGRPLVATPGCYVTAATLALRPLVEAGLIETTGVIVDAASGRHGCRSGATTHENSFTTVDENFAAYGLLEPPAHARDGAGDRGAGAVHPAPRADEPRHPRHLLRPPHGAGRRLSTASLLELLRQRYAGEPFMVVGDGSPSTKATLGSNAVHVTARFDPAPDTVIALAALDNLTKGASGWRRPSRQRRPRPRRDRRPEGRVAP
jgi:N-acetyl-gamma-glutamyl-phosphate reductase